MLLRNSILWRVPHSPISKDFAGGGLRTRDVAEHTNQRWQRRHMGILDKIQEFINNDPALKKGVLWEFKELKTKKDGKLYSMATPDKLLAREKGTAVKLLHFKFLKIYSKKATYTCLINIIIRA